MRVVGVDGCPGGWLAMVYDGEEQQFTPRVHSSFAELLAAYPDARAIGVDIPIGLAVGIPRECDVQARRVLGRRRSSVFPAPDPRVSDFPTYTEASARSRELNGKGISQQGFAIFPKVAEVNQVITPDVQDRVIEVHPEVSFWSLAGDLPMTHPKKKPEGFEERRALLAAALDGVVIPSRREAQKLARPASADDVLDAIVAAWTARRHAERRSGRLPVEPPTDARGLRMEIVY
jgi:predicted RNase H-like nuclease